MTRLAPLDRFRHTLAGAARAIARDAEADVVFGSDAAASGKTARVVSPGPGMEPRLVAEARGGA
ncbi:MAG: cobaltochelatase subunit CobT, partial [Pseudomonadota bacterium]|nr:cobaltochelatase subunit CobT [Pseudomonadota bacterium]